MSKFKTGLSVVALLAGVSLIVGAPAVAVAKAHCKTKVVKVLVKKVVCDCGPSHHAAAPAHHAHHAVATTSYPEPAYSRPPNVTYVDEVDSTPVMSSGQSVYLGESSYSRTTYSSQSYSSNYQSGTYQSGYSDGGCQTVCTYAPPVATYSDTCSDSCTYPQDDNVVYDDDSYQDDGLYPNDGPYPYQDTSTYTGGVGYTDTSYGGGGGYYSDGAVAPSYGYGGTVIYMNGKSHYGHSGGGYHHSGGDMHQGGGYHSGGMQGGHMGGGHMGGGMSHGGGMHGGHMGGGMHSGGHYGGHH